MKIAIMQPYFMPYLGYFSLIKNTDKFIIFDNVQFIRHGWIERNRILKPENGWQYIGVPLKKHHRETIIKDIRICNYENWRGRIFRQIEHYKKIAPYYLDVVGFLNKTLESDFESITSLNVHLLSETCKYLGIEFNFEIFSEMELEIDPVKGPGDWALNISKALNVSEYVNLSGGMEIFNLEAFNKEHIKIEFLKINLSEYNQRKRPFEPGLSIIDVMMFNSKSIILKLLDNYITL